MPTIATMTQSTYLLCARNASSTSLLVLASPSRRWRRGRDCAVLGSQDVDGYLSLDPSTLEDMGAKDTYKIVNDFQIWRLVTCCFLHAGWIHLLMNMFVQVCCEPLPSPS